MRYHNCSAHPIPTDDSEAAKEAFARLGDEVYVSFADERCQRYFPHSVEVVRTEDGKFHVACNGEFAVPIVHCPFCGTKLADASFDPTRA